MHINAKTVVYIHFPAISLDNSIVASFSLLAAENVKMQIKVVLDATFSGALSTPFFAF